MTYEKQCITCGKTFHTNRKNQKNCSQECSKTYREKYIKEHQREYESRYHQRRKDRIFQAYIEYLEEEVED